MGIVALLLVMVVALWWLRDGDSPTVAGQGGPAATAASTRTTTTSSTPTTTPTTQSQASLPAALASPSEVISAGERRGTIDPAAEDLLHQAEDVARAVDEGEGDDARKKLEELERKVDELVREARSAPLPQAGRWSARVESRRRQPVHGPHSRNAALSASPDVVPVTKWAEAIPRCRR